MNLSYVIEGENDKEKSYEIFSRLLKDRIIYIQGSFEDSMANNIVAQLLYLNSQDKEKDISIYINSPGGQISSMYAIADCMSIISPNINTVCIGICASAASFILASGTKGKRAILPNASVMIHELSGGTQGKAQDIFIEVDKIKKMYDKMAKQYVHLTGKSLAKIKRDMSRDHWLDAEDALEYGIVDKIISNQ